MKRLFTVVLSCTVVFLSEGRADIIFQQDFTASTVLSDYVGVGEANKFDHIGQVGTVSTISIVNDALVIQRGATAGTNDDGSGFLRSTDFSGPPELLRVTLTVNPTAGFWGPFGMFKIGNYGASQTNYQSQGAAAADRFSQFEIRGRGSNYRYEFGSSLISSDIASGTASTVDWYLNDSASDLDYVGPDSLSYTLNPSSVSFFVNGALITNNLAATAGANSDMSNFRFGVSNTAANWSLAFEEMTFEVIPEPSAVMLFMIGIAGLGWFRGVHRRHRT